MRIESIKNYREPKYLVITETSPRIGAKNPPPINSTRIEPIAMCWPRLYGILLSGGGAVFGTSGTLFSPPRYVDTVIIRSIMETNIVRIPTIENGKNVRIVIAGKHMPPSGLFASMHGPSPFIGDPHAFI